MIVTQPQVPQESPSPAAVAWMPRKLSAAGPDSLDLIRAVAACAVPQERWQPTPLHLLTAASVGATSFLFVWLVSTVTEAKTDVARGLVKRIL